MAQTETEILIDDREHALIARLGGVPGVRVERLRLGDVLIGGVLIERKTEADLAASIKDGRWREQVARMRAVEGFTPVVVVEGFSWCVPSSGDGAVNGIPRGTLRSALLGCALRDGICVMPTGDVDATAGLVVAIRAKSKGLVPLVPPGPSGLPKKVGASTRREVAICQLCAVPRVSPEMAEQMLGSFETLADWMSSPDFDSGRIAELRRANGKRYGNAVSEKVVALLLGVGVGGGG